MKLDQLSRVKSTITLVGETGCGKSTFARAIHDSSERLHRPFITAHLGSINSELFDSELFGHKKGAFTGATHDKTGLCGEVGGGTLFLDEVGELSLADQKKLLELLEERKYRKVGCSKSRSFRGVVILATNKNLKKMVKEGSFREDLYYRICIFKERVKPLRECKGEIVPLLVSYLSELSEIYGCNRPRLTRELEEFLGEYHWPGNIRELKNLCEYLVCMGSSLITMENLPDWIDTKPTKLNKLEGGDEELVELDYHRALENFEAKFFNAALVKLGGRINNSAKVLGVSKTTLIAKIKKYGINTLQIRANEVNFSAHGSPCVV